MADAIIVLAMHGAPPKDFPRREAGELFQLHAQLEHVRGPERAALERRYAELDAKMRAWPRTRENDPFSAGSEDLGAALARASGREVIVGYNEFCAPGLDEVLDQAAARAGTVIVVTAMMTRGGEHSEVDIPEAVARARGRHPAVRFEYVWPLEAASVAGFLTEQIHRQMPA